MASDILVNGISCLFRLSLLQLQLLFTYSLTQRSLLDNIKIIIVSFCVCPLGCIICVTDIIIISFLFCQSCLGLVLTGEQAEQFLKSALRLNTSFFGTKDLRTALR